MDELIAGYRRFRENDWLRERERFETLADQGQSPHTMVLACSDSRVDPQMILAARPGELFVIRNVANLVPPFEIDLAHHGTSAALEFGVRVLRVKRLMVMGHGMCGGVRALLEAPPIANSDFIERWMALARAAVEPIRHLKDPEARRRAGEEETVRLSLKNLATFPWVREAVAAGELELVGAYFDIRQGVLFLLQPDGGFAPAPGTEATPDPQPSGVSP